MAELNFLKRLPNMDSLLILIKKETNSLFICAHNELESRLRYVNVGVRLHIETFNFISNLDGATLQAFYSNILTLLLLYKFSVFNFLFFRNCEVIIKIDISQLIVKRLSG